MRKFLCPPCKAGLIRFFCFLHTTPSQVTFFLPSRYLRNLKVTLFRLIASSRDVSTHRLPRQFNRFILGDMGPNYWRVRCSLFLYG